VSLSRASPTTSTVQFATADGTAIAATDYQTTSGTLFFKSSTTQTVSVPVIDDSVDELDESFFVNLSNATSAAIYDAQGIGTITDNDPPPNTAPTARPDSYSTNEDTVLSANVLSNDSDPDSGDTLTAVVVNVPTNGELDLNADGSFTYTPNADFNGTDSFTYRASDGSADSNVATVTITVTPVNDAPKIEVVGGTQSTCLSNTSARTTLKLTDVDSSATNLTLSHNSSNTTLLPNSNVTFAASATTLIRTATITTVSGRTGISTVTITVSDDGQASTTTTVSVRAGGNGRDSLSGTSEADILLGQNGDDTLSGLAKSDVLCGANGNDRLTGGLGADHFGGGSGTDTATDFNASQGDTRVGIP
jgi:VCBS repeat-containing protein